MDDSKIHIRASVAEVRVRKYDLDPDKWMLFPQTGLPQYVFWGHSESGA